MSADPKFTAERVQLINYEAYTSNAMRNLATVLQNIGWAAEFVGDNSLAKAEVRALMNQVEALQAKLRKKVDEDFVVRRKEDGTPDPIG